MSTHERLPLLDADADNLLTRVAYSLHPARLALLSMLLRGDATTGELGARLGLTPTQVTKHLTVLRAQRVVTFQMENRRRRYSLAGGPAAEALAVLLSTLEASLTPPAPRKRPGAAVTARGRRATQQEE